MTLMNLNCPDYDIVSGNLQFARTVSEHVLSRANTLTKSKPAKNLGKFVYEPSDKHCRLDMNGHGVSCSFS